MLLLATLCLLVGSSLGAPKDMMPGKDMMGMGMMHNDSMSGGMMQMCCMPKSWEGTLVDLKQKGPNMNSLMFAHDDDMMREGYYLIPVGMDKPSMQVYNDYVDMKTYTVDMTSSNPKDYTCKQSRNEMTFTKSCGGDASMIKNMHYIGDATIGGSSGIHYDGWSFTMGNMDIVLTLSRDGCVPVFENVKSLPGMTPEFDMLLMFDNVSPKVMHKELLSIPAACVNTASAVVG